jgi:putative oxidoreductase
MFKSPSTNLDNFNNKENVMSSTLTQSRGTTITLWVLRILIGAMFILAGVMKLTSQPMMVTEFDQVGLGQWFRYVTGALELLGGIAVLVPRYSSLGAILLFLIDLGAFIAQVTVLHADWIHTIVIGLIIGALIYLQRRSWPLFAK